MAMPASGCLHLCNPSVTGDCRSIAHAVYGASPPASVSLYNAGICANFTDPILMTSFYGYDPSYICLIPSGALFGSEGGFSAFDVCAPSSLGWCAYTEDDWIFVTGGVYLSSGDDSVSYDVDSQNRGAPAREGYIYVESSSPFILETFTINQDAG